MESFATIAKFKSRELLLQSTPSNMFAVDLDTPLHYFEVDYCLSCILIINVGQFNTIIKCCHY